MKPTAVLYRRCTSDLWYSAMRTSRRTLLQCSRARMVPTCCL